VENAVGRQMAEGSFNRRYAPKGYGATRAVTRAVPHINAHEVQGISEVDIDISYQKSTLADFVFVKTR
jgi:hypothetical protein